MTTKLSTQLASRRAAKSARRRLEHELAAYSTPAERSELDAILARHTDDEGADIRQILSARRAS